LFHQKGIIQITIKKFNRVMKKILLAGLFAVLLAGSAVAADATGVTSAIMTSFQNNFNNATDVSWTTKSDYSKASFTLNNRRMEAFYNTQGEMIASSENIKLEELPVNAKRTFAKEYGSYEVKEAIHFQSNEEDAYFISAQSEKESVIIKVLSDQSLSVFKKVKK
jgi:hypothetical protein